MGSVTGKLVENTRRLFGSTSVEVIVGALSIDFVEIDFGIEMGEAVKVGMPWVHKMEAFCE